MGLYSEYCLLVVLNSLATALTEVPISSRSRTSCLCSAFDTGGRQAILLLAGTVLECGKPVKYCTPSRQQFP